MVSCKQKMHRLTITLQCFTNTGINTHLLWLQHNIVVENLCPSTFTVLSHITQSEHHFMDNNCSGQSKLAQSDFGCGSFYGRLTPLALCYILHIVLI